MARGMLAVALQKEVREGIRSSARKSYSLALAEAHLEIIKRPVEQSSTEPEAFRSGTSIQHRSVCRRLPTTSTQGLLLAASEPECPGLVEAHLLSRPDLLRLAALGSLYVLLARLMRAVSEGRAEPRAQEMLAVWVVAAVAAARTEQAAPEVMGVLGDSRLVLPVLPAPVRLTIPEPVAVAAVREVTEGLPAATGVREVLAGLDSFESLPGKDACSSYSSLPASARPSSSCAAPRSNRCSGSTLRCLGAVSARGSGWGRRPERVVS